MRESFRLTLRALVRGQVLTLLLASVALIHALFPAIVRGDVFLARARDVSVGADCHTPRIRFLHCRRALDCALRGGGGGARAERGTDARAHP